MHKSIFLDQGHVSFNSKLIDDFDGFGRNNQCYSNTVRMTVREVDGGIYVLVTRKTGQEKSTPHHEKEDTPHTLNLLRFEQVKSEGFFFMARSDFLRPASELFLAHRYHHWFCVSSG